MATLTVGTGQQYTTIADAVAASSSGDTINVEAGTYTNDFVTISHDLTLNAVGGTVTMVATEQPPDGKAMIDEGGAGVSVTINGFDMSGVTVPDGNGAAIRYEGGNLTLNNDTIHNNQEGLLSASDPNGTITIDNSTFSSNGAGDGYTHNIYAGDIASLTVENSTITAADVGHDIKSRAATTTVLDNTITDGATGTASYEVDLPRGGNATIEGNVIEKGANAQNPIAISYGEEGNLYADGSLTVAGNTILNDDTGASTTAVKNATSTTASITGNSLYGWSNIASGPVTLSGNTTLSTEPALSSLSPGSTTSSTSSSAATTGMTTTGTTTTGSDTGSASSSGSSTTPSTTASGTDTGSAGTTASGSTSGTDTGSTDNSGSSSSSSSGIPSSGTSSGSVAPVTSQTLGNTAPGFAGSSNTTETRATPDWSKDHGSSTLSHSQDPGVYGFNPGTQSTPATSLFDTTPSTASAATIMTQSMHGTAEQSVWPHA